MPLERDASVPPPVKDDGAPTETTAASGKTDGTTETSAFARVVIHDLPTLLLPVAIPAAEDDDDITTAEEDDDSAEVRRDVVALVVVVVVVAVMASGDGGMFVCGGGSATVVVADRGEADASSEVSEDTTSRQNVKFIPLNCYDVLCMFKRKVK